MSSFSRNCNLQFRAFFLEHHRSIQHGQEYLFEPSKIGGKCSEVELSVKN